MQSRYQQARAHHRALEITWLAVIFLIPLFFNPLGFQIYSISKALLLQFLVITALALWIADWTLHGASHQQLNWKHMAATPLHLPILVFGLMAILATAISIMPGTSFWGTWGRKSGLLTLLCWILFFLILSQQLRHRAQLLRAVYCLLFSSGIVSYLGILQHFFPDVLYRLFQCKPEERVFSTIGNPLFLSGFLAMVIPLNLALIVNAWNRPFRSQPSTSQEPAPAFCIRGANKRRDTIILGGLVILLLLQFWCLWLAQYSITILLYIIGPIVFVILLGIVGRKKLLLCLGGVSLLTIVIIAALLLVPLLFPSTDVKAPETGEVAAIISAEDLGLVTLDWRAKFWRSTVDIIVQSPEIPLSGDSFHRLRKFTGYGLEAFIVPFQLYFPEELKTQYTYISRLVDHPHNHYLYLATVVGLPGLLGFMSIFAVFFYLCLRYLSNAKTAIDKLVLMALMAAIVQHMADLFFNPPTICPELVFWLILSLVPAIGRLTSDDIADTTGVEKPTPIQTPPYTTRTRLFLSLGCATALILVGTGITIRPFLADMYLHRAVELQAKNEEQAAIAFHKATEIYSREAAYWGYLGAYNYYMARRVSETPRKKETLSLAAAAYEKACQREPYIAFWYYSLADIYTYWAKQGAADKWAEAFSLYHKALQLFPDNAVILNKWALALIIKGDFAEARAKLNYSKSIDPHWADTSFLFGLLSAREGKYDEATHEIISTIQANPTNLNYFIDLCRQLYAYDMVSYLGDSLEMQVQKASDEWAAHAAVGITSFFSNNFQKSCTEFNSAMMSVPDNNVGYLFRTILNLANISPQLKKALHGVAAEWRDRIERSPDRATLLPELDRLINRPQ